MTIGEIDPQVFGELRGDVRMLLKNQETYREDQMVANNILFAKIDNLSINGCARGLQHDKDVLDLKLKLKQLEERPGKIVGLGVAIIGIISVVAGFFIWLHGKLDKLAWCISRNMGVG